MKILYFSNNYTWGVMGTKRSIFEELKRRGHDVIWINKKLVNNTATLCRKHKAEQVWLSHSNLTLLPHVKEKTNALVIGFGFSDPYYFKPSRFKNYDVYVTNNRGIYEKHKTKIKMFYNPTACDVQFHTKKNVKKIIDISLIGRGRHLRFPDKKERIKIVNRLREDLPEKLIRTYGTGWPKNKDSMAAISGNKFLNVIQTSKIGIDIQEDFSPLAHRMFEYSACGIPVITRRRPEVFEHLEDGKEILSYDNYDELLELLKYYLNNPKQLSKIAENGYQKVTKEHDVKNRVDGLERFLGL